jgi:hypothetical protein
VDLGALAAISPWIVLLVALLIHAGIVFINRDVGGGINWGLFVAPVVLAAFIFGITLVTSGNPNGLHVPNGSYWRSPEHYPQARAHIYAAQAWLASLMGIFIDLATILAIQSKRSASGNISGPMSIGLVVFFIAAMSIWFGIIGGGWEIPVR